jgi:hypothetical protein
MAIEDSQLIVEEIIVNIIEYGGIDRSDNNTAIFSLMRYSSNSEQTSFVDGEARLNPSLF